MARQFLFSDLYARLEKLTDSENDSHISPQEKREAINAGVAETWDVICSSGLGEKYVKSVTFNSTANTMEYSIATVVSAGDFYRIHQLYSMETDGLMRPLKRVQPSELFGFKAPPQVCSMKLYYIPCAPAPSPLDVDSVAWGATTFDGINGWEELVLMCAASAIKFKKDDSYGNFAQKKQELIRRIGSMGNIDFGDAPRVQTKMNKRSAGYWAAFQNPVTGYGVRGDKIELYYYSDFTGW